MAAVKGVEGKKPAFYISDPATGGCSDLCNAAYKLLQMTARYFTFATVSVLPESRRRGDSGRRATPDSLTPDGTHRNREAPTLSGGLLVDMDAESVARFSCGG